MWAHAVRHAECGDLMSASISNTNEEHHDIGTVGLFGEHLPFTNS